MKIKNILYIVLISFSLSMSAVVSSSELIENAKKLDNTYIEYQGEAIGSLMVRGDNAWLNVNDGNNALGIWGSASIFNDVKMFGGYFNLGDTVLIKGIFHKACLEHGGDMDLHAVQVDLVKSGYKLEHHVSLQTISLAIFWVLVALGLFFYNRKSQK